MEVTIINKMLLELEYLLWMFVRKERFQSLLEIYLYDERNIRVVSLHYQKQLLCTKSQSFIKKVEFKQKKNNWTIFSVNKKGLKFANLPEVLLICICYKFDRVLFSK